MVSTLCAIVRHPGAARDSRRRGSPHSFRREAIPLVRVSDELGVIALSLCPVSEFARIWC
jgi:hypothetical protein